MIHLAVLLVLLQTLLDQSRAQTQIRHNLASTTLFEGDSLLLNCVILDPTYDQIKWFKDTIQLSNNAEELFPDEYQIAHSSTVGDGLQQYSLTVSSLRKENDGEYKCKASRGTNRPKNKKLKISVLYTPDERYPKCSYADAMLVCYSEIGKPVRGLTWKQFIIDNGPSNDVLISINTIEDKFHHNQTITVPEVPAPLTLDDELMCMFVDDASRNCSLPYVEVYDSFAPPNISPGMTIDIGDNASVTCTSENSLHDSRLAFNFTSYPSVTNVDFFNGEGNIVFVSVGKEVQRIDVWCNLIWGAFQSNISDVSYIYVNHTNDIDSVTTVQGAPSTATNGSTTLALSPSVATTETFTSSRPITPGIMSSHGSTHITTIDTTEQRSSSSTPETASPRTITPTEKTTVLRRTSTLPTPTPTMKTTVLRRTSTLPTPTSTMKTTVLRRTSTLPTTTSTMKTTVYPTMASTSHRLPITIDTTPSSSGATELEDVPTTNVMSTSSTLDELTTVILAESTEMASIVNQSTPSPTALASRETSKTVQYQRSTLPQPTEIKTEGIITTVLIEATEWQTTPQSDILTTVSDQPITEPDSEQVTTTKPTGEPDSDQATTPSKESNIKCDEVSKSDQTDKPIFEKGTRKKNGDSLKYLLIILICSLGVALFMVTSKLIFQCRGSQSGSYRVNSVSARQDTIVLSETIAV